MEISNLQLLQTNWISSIANVLLISYLILILLPFLNKTVCLIVSLILSILIIFMPNYHGFSLLELGRGIFGDLSITTLVFLICCYFKKLGLIKTIPLDNKFAWLIFITGLVLYFSTLGIIATDFYAIGYFLNWWILSIFFILEIFIYLKISKLYAWVWCIALFAFYLQLQTSNNLWDYLIDSILWILALFKVIASLIISKKEHAKWT